MSRALLFILRALDYMRQSSLYKRPRLPLVLGHRRRIDAAPGLPTVKALRVAPLRFLWHLVTKSRLPKSGPCVGPRQHAWGPPARWGGSHNAPLCDPGWRKGPHWRAFRPARIATYRDSDTRRKHATCSEPERKSTSSLPDIWKTHEQLEQRTKNGESHLNLLRNCAIMNMCTCVLT